MRAISLAVLLSSLLAYLSAEPADSREVRTGYGRVSGIEQGEIRVFKGIPYAAPPVGPLRWHGPLPPGSWEGVRDATSFGPACIQPSRVQPQSEDCLYLNIWTGAAARNAPVLVWLHGGGYLTGSGSLPFYDGTALARLGAVVVTLNYRLGVLGFLAHPQLSRESPDRVSGNYGLLDQLAGLRWVRDNIAAFGGDPRNVTIFGESAGAGSVSCLLFSPLAKGLFHRAIVESGALDDQLRDLRLSRNDIESAERQGKELAHAVGCGGSSTLTCLRQMSGRLLLRMLRPVSCLDCTQRGTFGPVVDGYLIPGQPFDLLAAGKLNAVELMTGSNRGEGAVVIGGRPVPTVEGYHAWITTRFRDRSASILAAYPAPSDAAVRTALNDVYTDSWYLCPARSMAIASPVSFVYQFTRELPHLDSRTSHGAEIPYVFDTLHAGQIDDTDRRLARTMTAAWYRFAATGNPNGAGLPEWPRFGRERQASLEFGDPVHVNLGQRTQCDVWRFAGHTAGIPGGSF